MKPEFFRQINEKYSSIEFN